MKKQKLDQTTRFWILACVLAAVLACESSPTGKPEDGSDVAATVAESVEQTLDAQPSATESAETPTRVPVTNTPKPAPPTPVPTTPVPTTPAPSATPRPEPAAPLPAESSAEPKAVVAELAATPTRFLLTATPIPIIIPTLLIVQLQTRTPQKPYTLPSPTSAPRPPVMHATGHLLIPQTCTADLDEGIVKAGSAADIWLEVRTTTAWYVTPRNGATIAIVGTKSVGRDGCAAASLSGESIPINHLPEGTYVCVCTNLGRYAQFRVNAPIKPTPGTMKIGFTTWE